MVVLLFYSENIFYQVSLGTCILQTTLTYMARLCSYFIRREFLHEIFMDKAFPQLEHFDKMQLILFFFTQRSET